MATAIAPEYYTKFPYIKKLLPESDGKPMAETDAHRDQMIDLLDALKEYFRQTPDVYVTGNIFLHFHDAGGELRSVAPDIFVARGIEKKDRRYYNLDAEKKSPDVVIELVSNNTKLEDFGNKRVLYADLGVQEYFLFDPTAELLSGQLRGFLLQGGEYVPMLGARLPSEVLGLDLVVERQRLRLYDSQTGQRLLTHEESEAARRAAETQAARELSARQTAETELARLREELGKLRRGKS